MLRDKHLLGPSLVAVSWPLLLVTLVFQLQPLLLVPKASLKPPDNVVIVCARVWLGCPLQAVYACPGTQHTGASRTRWVGAVSGRARLRGLFVALSQLLSLGCTLP